MIFESPYRLTKLIRELHEAVGADAHAAIIREATKLHEEILRGTLAELTEKCANRSWKGVILSRKTTSCEDMPE